MAATSAPAATTLPGSQATAPDQAGPPTWPSFRGPAASGVVENAEPPASFDGASGANLAWKVEIPGLAHAGPIVWGDRVYLTTAVSETPPPRFFAAIPDGRESVVDATPHRWMVMALDRATGELLWERTAAEGVPRGGRLRKGTFNNSTPATDGDRIVAWFGAEGLFCYDVNGNLLWQVDLGSLESGWFFDPTVQWGTGSSPIIHDGKVIVQADVFDDGFIAAFDVSDGRELWRTAREGPPSWSTPTVVSTSAGDIVVANGGEAVRAYDIDTGAELWHLEPSSRIAVPTPVFADGLIFVGSGYLPTQPLYAVRPGGSGDVSPPEGRRAGGSVAWRAPDRGPLIATPIVVDGYLYVLDRDGTLTCFDAGTGLPMYREKLVAEPSGDASGAGQGAPSPVRFSASPVAAAGRLYVAAEDGRVFVLPVGPLLEDVSVSPVGEAVFATPAIAGDMLLVRGLQHLYAFR